MSAEDIDHIDSVIRGVEVMNLAQGQFAEMYKALVKARALIPEPPTDDERQALSNFLFTVYDHGTKPNALREADAILSFLRNRHRGPITDDMVDAALSVLEEREHEMTSLQDDMRAALEAAEAHRA